MTNDTPLPKRIIKSIKYEMNEHKSAIQIVIQKHPEIFDIGQLMMEYMHENGGTNYVSIQSLAPDGKLYTFTVNHDRSVPKSIIIQHLKAQIATLSEYIHDDEATNIPYCPKCNATPFDHNAEPSCLTCFGTGYTHNEDLP